MTSSDPPTTLLVRGKYEEEVTGVDVGVPDGAAVGVVGEPVVRPPPEVVGPTEQDHWSLPGQRLPRPSDGLIVVGIEEGVQTLVVVAGTRGLGLVEDPNPVAGGLELPALGCHLLDGVEGDLLVPVGVEVVLGLAVVLGSGHTPAVDLPVLTAGRPVELQHDLHVVPGQGL